MAANSLSTQLGNLVFSAAKRPGVHLISMLQKSIEKEYRRIYFEQIQYQGAFLGRARHLTPEEYPQLYTTLNDMSLEEHKVIVKGEYLEQTFYILLALHSIARNAQIVFDQNTYKPTSETALLDPNFFPVFTRSKHKDPKYVSLWEHFPDEIRNRLLSHLGFRLYLEESTVSHSEAGSGVFLETLKPVSPGTMLGFFPGTIYDSRNLNLKAQKVVASKTELPYLRRFNGNAVYYDDPLVYPCYKLGYSLEDYLIKLERSGRSKPIEVDSEKINPYALGHKINHTPPGTAPNVCLLDLEVDKDFLPGYLMRYFPYMEYSSPPRGWSEPLGKYHIVVVVALSELRSGEELFLNYGNERFLEDFRPDWLVEPPEPEEISAYLNKQEVLYDFSRLNKTLMKWDEVSSTAIESIELERKKKHEEAVKKSLEDPQLFEKYYKK
mmetsp:Transcript_9820/g.14643  ORF Transcript_9820/g.14643 Transcript_9820/m.14643 type:complete len:437 (-) Transcript_9820:29-1339(-)